MNRETQPFRRRTVLKTAGAGIGATSFLSLSGGALAGDHKVTVDLLAAQDIDVGTVTAQASGDDLTVTYDTLNTKWELVETHLHVGDDFDDIPTTRSGNPQVGRFEYSGLPDPSPADSAVYEVKIGNMSDVIYVAAHAVVQNTVQEAPYGGVEVVDTMQAWRYDGTDVRSQRSNPDTVLTREFGQNESNFYSLGYGGVLNDGGDAVEEFFGEHFEDQRDPGEIRAMEGRIDASLKAALSDTEENAGWVIIRFDPSILNIEDDIDLWVVEDTWGLPYPLELAAVFARIESDDDWKFVCLAHNQEPAPDVSGIIHTVTECELGDLEEAVYILVQDVTDPRWFSDLHPSQSDTLDGYDLNAVEALQDHVEDETAWGDGERFVNRGNWATYFTYNLEE